MTNFLSVEGCRCPTAMSRVHSALTGVPLPACPVHDSDAVAARKAAMARDDADRVLARERAVFDEIRTPRPAPEPTCSCSPKADIDNALRGQPIAPCSVHRPAPSAFALNDIDAISSALGMPVTPSDHGADAPSSSD